MSLNKFTNLQIGKDLKLKIGAQEIDTNNLIVKTVDNQNLNFRTPDIGSVGEVLKTDGAGGVFWGSGGGGGGGIVYSGSLPIPAGQHVTISTDGTTVNQSVLNETLTDLNINGLNLTGAINVECDSISTGVVNTSNIDPVAGDLNLGVLPSTDIIRLSAVTGVYSTSPLIVSGGDGISADKFTKNGGLSTQYLMADGSSLNYSQNSGNSNFYLYNSIDDVTTPPPASGKVGYNNSSQALTTILYINHLTSDNIDIDVFFAQLTTIQQVYLQDRNSSLNFIKYDITSEPQLISNSYISIPVSYTFPNGAGTGLSSFGSNHPIIVSFFTNSIEVDSRLSNLETKTQNQSANTTTTTFTGTGGVVASKFDSLGTSLSFVKGDGSLDNTSYLPLSGGTMTGLLATSTGSPALQINGSLDGNLYPLTNNLYNVGINNFSYANSEINNMNTKNLLLWNTDRTFRTQITSSNTANATYVMPTTQAERSSLLLNDGTGNLSWSNSANYISQNFSQFVISFNGIALQTSNGFYPINGFSSIGGANTAVTPASTNTLTKILKLRLNTSVVADGQRSGYIGTANHPVLYGGAGWNYNFSFGIGDTNTAATSVCQMLCGFTTSLTTPAFSSTLNVSQTPNIFGVGCDVNDTVLSFYMRGTSTGQKIATPFLSLTPSSYWLNLNVYNPVNSNVIILTLTDKISGLTATQPFSFSAGSPTAAVLYSSQIYPILCRGMAVSGGITGSAQNLFSRFALTIL
jgi:hypothetical protein